MQILSTFAIIKKITKTGSVAKHEKSRPTTVDQATDHRK